MRGPEVGDRGGHHQHVGLRGALGHRVAQLGRGADVDDLDTGGIDQPGGVPGDQGDLGAALGRHPRHGIALLARAAVADEAHRVDRFAGAAGGDQHLAAGEVVGQRVVAFQQQVGQGGDLLGFGQPARPAVRPGEAPGGGLEHHRAPPAQRGHVVDGGRVQPHLGVHGRREQHRASGGEQRGGQQIVGPAVHRARQQIRRRRRHHDQVGLLAELDVRDLGNVVEDAGVHRLAGERSKVAAPTKRSADSVGMTRTE